MASFVLSVICFVLPFGFLLGSRCWVWYIFSASLLSIHFTSFYLSSSFSSGRCFVFPSLIFKLMILLVVFRFLCFNLTWLWCSLLLLRFLHHWSLLPKDCFFCWISESVSLLVQIDLNQELTSMTDLWTCTRWTCPTYQYEGGENNIGSAVTEFLYKDTWTFEGILMAM